MLCDALYILFTSPNVDAYGQLYYVIVRAEECCMCVLMYHHVVIRKLKSLSIERILSRCPESGEVAGIPKPNEISFLHGFQNSHLPLPFAQIPTPPKKFLAKIHNLEGPISSSKWCGSLREDERMSLIMSAGIPYRNSETQ